jgi:hypothetical protein
LCVKNVRTWKIRELKDHFPYVASVTNTYSSFTNILNVGNTIYKAEPFPYIGQLVSFFNTGTKGEKCLGDKFELQPS